jgi:hypothetical protein
MTRINGIAIVVSLTIFASGCTKDSNPTPPDTTYTVPTTYTFANFNDSNSLKLLAMIDQLVAKINLANTVPNTIVSAQTLTGMFNNTGGDFNDSALHLNGSGLRLADYFPAPARTDMLNYFDSIGLYSQSTTGASDGTAGVSASSANAAKKYLLSPNGVFYSQVIKKAMMGMTAYQITNAYLHDSIGATTDTPTLEHYWDAAFGLWGVPVNFPTSTTGLRYFGSYSNQVNAGMNSNTQIMGAFLKGRAAIANNDLATMKTQASLLIRLFDTLDAACIVQEMHETNTNIEAGDAVAAYGTLSESLGFVRTLSYNNSSARVITATQFQQLLGLFDSSNPTAPNLYDFVGVAAGLTAQQIEAKTNAITQLIGQTYGFSTTQLSQL